MTWLGGWLREIILVVLLAAFVEMLLPSKSMERYARLVLSLLILLTLLNPIVSLLKGDAMSELSLAIGKQEKESGLLPGGAAGSSLESILASGREMADGREQQSLKLAAEEVAGQMRDQINTEAGIQGVQVTVSLAMGKSKNSGNQDIPVISSVQVVLPPAEGNSDTSSSHGSTAGPIVIPPVQDIRVTIGSGGDNSSRESEASEGLSVEEEEQQTNGGPDPAREVTEMLEQKWLLEPGIVQVQETGISAAKL